MLSPNFFIGTIRIGTVEGASCVNFGNNVPTGFESYKKHSQGFGSISGDSNQIEGLRSLLTDSAIIDMLASNKDYEVPEWLKDVILEKMKKGD